MTKAQSTSKPNSQKNANANATSEPKSRTWMPSEGELELPKAGLAGNLLAAARLALVVLWLLVCVVSYLLVRLIERPLSGAARPVSAYIAQGFCRGCISVMGLRLLVRGKPMQHPGAVVSNHVSWLDIWALYATQRVYFVSKASVRDWPLVGSLAAMVGTIFIQRTRSHAHAQTQLLQSRFALGHKLLFFPEGTSTDGRRLLPFNPTLFAAMMDAPEAWVQPVSLIYIAPKGEETRFLGWFGTTGIGPHFWAVASRFARGTIEVEFQEPIKTADFGHRREIAKLAEQSVRQGLVRAEILDA